MFLALKTEGDLRRRARTLAFRAGIPTVLVAASFLVWTTFAFGSVPTALLAAVAALALVASLLANLRGWEGWAFGLMAATIGFAVLALFASLFPDVMPASNNAANSLTIDNASSTPYTLEVMTWTALFAMPVILLYQGWSYWVFRKRVSRSSIEAAAH